MVEAILLGIAQDAGVPQAGCDCPRCGGARRDPARRKLAVSLGVVDWTGKKFFIIDATPDFREQFGLLMDFAPECALGGILITHLHMGHYTGLIHLGEEAANLKKVPLYCTGDVGEFVRGNAPWSNLVRAGNLEIVPISPEVEFSLSEDLIIEPIEVPHRAAPGETLAFRVAGPARQLFYCPDIDSWDAWRLDLRSFISDFDMALLDGSFYGEDEVPHRDLATIPHPLIQESMDKLDGVDCEVVFVHLNHTNPMLDSQELQNLAARRGFQVGFRGQIWQL